MEQRTSLDPWITFPRRDAGASLRLFVFPYAGGGAAAFRDWHSDLPRGVELCPVQPPGRESRWSEERLTDVGEAVEAARDALLPYLEEKPFVLMGHSLGGVLAFELARRLRSTGGPRPLRLVVSGRSAPHVPPPTPPLHTLPDDELLEELRRLGGTPDEVMESPELMELMLPVLRADFTMSETYVYEEGPPLACPISAFGGTEDLLTEPDDVAAWEDYTSQEFRSRLFPGGHFFVSSHRDEVLKALSAELRRSGLLS